MSDATRELIAAQDGSASAFERFITLTIDDVTRFCRYLGDDHRVDDLVQDTYLRALRGLRSYRGHGDGLRWLIAIARRVCADSIENEQRARRTEITRRPPVEHAAETELRLLIDGLPHDQRAAFVLTQILGYTYEEAAAVCDCATGTIRSRVARARDTLKGMLVDRMSEAS